MPSNRTYGTLFGNDAQLYANYGDALTVHVTPGPESPATVPGSSGHREITWVWLEPSHPVGHPRYHGYAVLGHVVTLTSRRELVAPVTPLPAPSARWNDEQDLADILRLLGVPT